MDVQRRSFTWREFLMTNHRTQADLQNDRPAVSGSDREKARRLFERSLHLDIFNVGSVVNSLTNE